MNKNVEHFFNCDKGFDKIIDDLAFTGEEVFTSEHLYNIVNNFVNNYQQISFLGFHLKFICRLEQDKEIKFEHNCLKSYLDTIISAIFAKQIELGDILLLVKDFYLSDYNEKYTSLLEKFVFVFSESLEDDKSLTYIDYVKDLCALDIFFAKAERALYSLNEGFEDSNDTDIVEYLLEVYDDKRCTFEHKGYFAFYLGKVFKYGFGVEIDLAKAYYYLTIAANYDVVEAKLLLADIYTEGNYLGKEENVAYTMIDNLYEERKKLYLNNLDEFAFPIIAAKLAYYLVNGIGVQKNEYYGHLKYLESFAAFEEQINNNNPLVEMNEFHKVVDYLNEHDINDLDVRETPLSDMVAALEDTFENGRLNIKIKELKHDYKFTFKLSDNSRISRLLLVFPAYDFSTVDDSFTFTIHKCDISNLHYLDTYIEDVCDVEYDDDTLTFLDEEENVVLTFKAENASYDFK